MKESNQDELKNAKEYVDDLNKGGLFLYYAVNLTNGYFIFEKYIYKLKFIKKNDKRIIENLSLLNDVVSKHIYNKIIEHIANDTGIFDSGKILNNELILRG